MRRLVRRLTTRSSGGSAPARQRIDAWLTRFRHALKYPENQDGTLFASRSYWRDMVAFTWNIKTFEGSSSIASALAATAKRTEATSWMLDKDKEPQTSADGVTEAWLKFETAAGVGKAHVRLNQDGQTAQTLLTTLQELHGHPFAVGRERALGAHHGVVKGRTYWHDELKQRHEQHAANPFVMIVGGGQAGLTLGARLGLLGVPYLIAESHPAPGSSWRARYPSLCLHDPVWYDHLPFLPMPDSWPVFTPREKMGDYLEAFAKLMDLNVSTHTRVASAQRNGEDSAWQVELEFSDGRPGRSVEAQHLVFATGMSGYRRVPKFAGADVFAGAQLHTSQYSGGAKFHGQRVVVVGSNTSAHDVSQDLYEQGALSVTMLQRSPGLVVSTDSILRFGLGALYSEDAIEGGMHHEQADLEATTWPYRLQERRWRDGSAKMQANDAELHSRLQAAGYQIDFGEHDTGVFGRSFRQGGGFYIDVGCCELICDGRVGLRSGVEVDRLTPRTVVLSSGEEIPADAIVYATGFGSMHRFVADIVSEEAADAVGPVWGLGSGTVKDPGPWQGELRNMWKPTAVNGLWFHGGNLAQARHYSRFVALQLGAQYFDVPHHVYRGTGDTYSEAQ
jgi:putative flavoprotein involved in K+ transport